MRDASPAALQLLDIILFSWILAVRKRGVEPKLMIRNNAFASNDQFEFFPLITSLSLGVPQISFHGSWRSEILP